MSSTQAEETRAAESEAACGPPIAYGSRAARGTIVNVSVQLAAVGLTYVVNLVLSWLLDPAHFGLLALANSWMVIAAVFRDAGASRILVQRQREFDTLAGTVFWLAFAASVICAVLTVAITPLLAHLFESPALAPVLLISALRLPLGAMGAVSTAKLTIDMRWRAQGIVQLGTLAISAAASIVMARAGWGVYSLIVPQTIAEGIRAAWLWRLSGLRPAQAYNHTAARMILGSSGYLMGSGLLFALRSQGDYIILGLTTSTMETGRYFMAFNTAVLGTRLLMSGLVPVLFSVFAKIAGERDRQEAALRRVFHTLAIPLLLATVLQASLSWPFFRLVMSPRWEGVATLFSMLSAVHFFTSMNGVIVQLVQAEGHFKPIFLFDVFFAPFELTMFIVGALLGGATGVAGFAALSAMIGFLLWHGFSCRLLRFSMSSLLVPLWRPLFAVVPVPMLAILTSRLLPSGMFGDVARILTVILIGSGTYAVLIWVLWRPVVKDAASLIQQSLRAYYPRKLATPSVEP